MKIFIPLMALLIGSAADARDYSVGSITITHPGAHSMVPGAKVGDGLMTIINKGDQPDKLISASSDRARSVQLHRMSIANGIMVMRELKGGLAIPAGQTIKLAPDYHLMFMEVDKPFKRGEEIRATLTFEKAGPVDVSFAVGKIAGPLDEGEAASMSMPGMDMGTMHHQVEDPKQAIPATLKTMFERPDKPLIVGPVVVQNDWGIAGWQQDGHGGRALLKNSEHGWRLHLCSGDGITKAADLQKIGLSATDAAALSARLKDAESSLSPQIVSLFASFEGTVLMGDDAGQAEHGGHEGHGL
jgi:copper(I)-binding protein